MGIDTGVGSTTGTYFRNNKIIRLLKKYWIFIVLLAIFYIAYSFRAGNIVPDKLLSFDPIFQYRFTRYFAELGHLPLWDELTYFAGRAIKVSSMPPLMFYVTSIIYWLQPFSWSLKTTASYMSAIYGSLIVIPAFMLGRELSNKYGGIIAALLVGTAPQILIRTFGSSYDTDQLVLFFILTTLYLGIYALKRNTIFSYSLAIMGFLGFMLMWPMFWYTFFLLLGAAIIYAILSVIGKSDNKHHITTIKTMVLLFGSILLIGTLLRTDPIATLLQLLGFAQAPGSIIVNTSIAELQQVNILSIGTWILAFGNFTTGDGMLDSIVLTSFVSLVVFSLFKTYKTNKLDFSFILTIILISAYTLTRGIRFTEFSSALLLVPVGIGIGHLLSSNKNNKKLLALTAALAISISFIALAAGAQLAPRLGPDLSSNWDSTWEFLRTETPTDSLVGTWWDPGHMITGLAERRVIADGAHCGSDECLYGINDRITNLGRVFIANDEDDAINTIRKYQGTSSKVYWIASEDLVSKFQWLQFFGGGCDARSDPNCQLYSKLPQTSIAYSGTGEVSARFYNIGGDPPARIALIEGPIPFVYVEQNNQAAFVNEVIYYNPDGNVLRAITAPEHIPVLKNMTQNIATQLNVEFTDNLLPLTLWVEKNRGYMVVIPQPLRNNMFTKMFFLEGEGLDKFKQVFRNDEVKIYEVEMPNP